jgi:hypothetical protein
MPKPEPLLILFLSIFLFYFTKNKGLLGKYFIFLGLAFGCKISISILVILIFLLSFILELKKIKNSQSKRNLYTYCLISILFFIIGWFMAVPIIPFSIIHLSIKGVISYLGSTFLSTGHGADDSTVNAIIWIKAIANDWIKAPLYSTVAMSLIIFSTILISSFYVIKTNSSSLKFNKLILTILNVSLIFPIIFFVKRLWFFYLHLGVVFLIIIFFYSLEILRANSIIKKFIYYLISFSFLLFSLFFLLSQQVTFLKNEANRTKNPEYIIQKERYKVILEKIHSNQNNISKPSVFYSPQFFRLSSDDFEFEQIWGFFKSWNLGKDFVVLCNSNNPKIYKPLQTNKDYKMWLKSNIEYDKYVNSKNINPTYIEIPVDIEGVYIFKKKSNK